MKQIVTTLYTFDELPQEVKQKALNENYFINTELDYWWKERLEEIEDLGFEVVNFELWRNILDITPQIEIFDIVWNIKMEHGENCKTYKIAKQFENLEISEDEFIDKISDEYLHIIRKEQEYLESDESIIETFRANNYHFDLNGKIKG